MRNVIMLVLFASLMACSTQETITVIKTGSSITELVQTWDGNKKALVKYRDMFDVDHEDRASLDGIIIMGDMVRNELAKQVKLQTVPSTDSIKLLFTEGDIAVQSGEALYAKYEANILPQDKFRAKLFMASWTVLRDEVAKLDGESSESERYAVAKEIFSVLLQVTTKVILPTLIASGKL